MKSFQKKRSWRNIVQSKPVLVILGIFVLIFAWGVIGFMKKMQTTIENKNIAEEKFLELQKEKDKLSTDILKLKTDSGVEESIREKFGLAKEGEGVIVVVEDENSTKVPEKKTNGFFSFFMNWFK
jgi:cell division protein FtsB